MIYNTIVFLNIFNHVISTHITTKKSQFKTKKIKILFRITTKPNWF